MQIITDDKNGEITVLAYTIVYRYSSPKSASLDFVSFTSICPN